MKKCILNNGKESRTPVKKKEIISSAGVIRAELKMEVM